MVNSSVRLDVPYMRKRVKRGSIQAAQSSSASNSLSLGSSSSLSLSGSDGSGSVAPEKQISLVPVLDGKTILSPEHPVVRLNPLQSAIGSLIISNAEAFAWEGLDGYGSLVLNGDPSPAPVFNGRKLVEFHKGDIVLGLRHFKQFRRLIAGTRHGSMKVSLYDGSEIAASGDNGDNALLFYRIGNEIEVRLEVIKSTDIINVFGIQVFPH